MPDEGLKELYIDELKDLYSAENQLVKALPKIQTAPHYAVPAEKRDFSIPGHDCNTTPESRRRSHNRTGLNACCAYGPPNHRQNS
jgi:Domain of unknown function (DUF892)